MYKYLIPLVFLTAGFVISACKTSQEQVGNEKAELVHFEPERKDFTIYKKTLIKEEKVVFGDFFFKTGISVIHFLSVILKVKGFCSSTIRESF